MIYFSQLLKHFSNTKNVQNEQTLERNKKVTKILNKPKIKKSLSFPYANLHQLFLSTTKMEDKTLQK